MKTKIILYGIYSQQRNGNFSQEVWSFVPIIMIDCEHQNIVDVLNGT